MQLKVLKEFDDFVEYGDIKIDFKVCQSKRKTLTIEVSPDKSVKVKAPITAAHEDIKERVIKKASWINKKQRYFEELPDILPRRNYDEGETFRYLGKQYRLKLEKGLNYKGKIKNGRLVVSMPFINKSKLEEIINNWYKEKAQIIFSERFEACISKVIKIGINHSGKFQIRKMKKRWGSCSSKGEITLNYELIKAPKDCIDYVIIHELCHVEEFNHSPLFYKKIEKIIPDWKAKKQKLNSLVEMDYSE